MSKKSLNNCRDPKNEKYRLVNCFLFSADVLLLHVWREERRDLPEPGPGVHPRDGVQGGQAVLQEQANHTGHIYQALHVPAFQKSSLHTLTGKIKMKSTL